MNTALIADGLIALVIIVYFLWSQLRQRVITQRTFLLPLIMAVVLGVIYFQKSPSTSAVIAVAVGVIAGVLTGLVSGQFLRVWRDGASGLVMQQGDWKYILVILGFIAIRGALRLVASQLHGIDEQALNVAFIAAIIGNFLGRAGIVLLRALALVGGDFAALPARRA